MRSKIKVPGWMGVPLNVMYFCGVLIVASDVVPLVWNNVPPSGVIIGKLEGLLVGSIFAAMAIQCILDGLKFLSEYLNKEGETE